MKAYVYHSDKTLSLEEKEKPVMGSGIGAVVELAACSICGTDIRTYRFGSEKIKDGRTIGHEIVGRIIALSPEWEGEFSVGNYISLAPAIGCGICPACRAGATNMCDDLETLGFQYDGGFAEYMAIPEKAFSRGNVYRLPEAEDYSVFALSEPLACVINAQSYLSIKPGESVMIIGGGIIGCMHAELARIAGASRVMIAETSGVRIEQARKLLPDTIFIDSARQNLEETVKEITDGRGVDVAVIACSVGQAQADGMKLLAKRGRISLFGGLPGEGTGFIDSNLIHYKELSVYGVHASTPDQNKQAMELIGSGVIDAGKYRTECYPLEEIETAFSRAACGDVMKIVIGREREERL